MQEVLGPVTGKRKRKELEFSREGGGGLAGEARRGRE